MFKVWPFKKKKVKAQKMRLTLRGGRLVRAYYPPHVACNKFRYAIAKQEVSSYEAKLNGGVLGLCGLGGFI